MATIRCDIDQTRRYLQGKMSAEEIATFEKNMATDVQFREEFDFNRDLLESMRIHYKSVLKDKLKNLEEDSVSPMEKKTKSRSLFLIAGVAAALALLVTLGYGLLFNQSDPEAVFEQYYTPYYNVLQGTERSVENTSGDLAMQLYDQQRYDKALQVFDEALEKDPDNTGLHFYKALSHMSLGQADSAIVHLNQVLGKAEDRWKEPARWYLGLAYLQSGDVKKAKEIFTLIKNSEDSYADRAKGILEDIN